MRAFLQRLHLLTLQCLHPGSRREDLRTLICRIDEPNAGRCLAFLDENAERLSKSWGSSHNHQAWEGGYLDHVREVMNLAVLLYWTLQIIGRPLPFSLSDALLVLFLHDAEKPWKYDVDARGKRTISERLATKEAQHAFRAKLFAKYGFTFTDAQQNALRYVEGEMDDYRSDRRVMNALAAFCHVCDILSARLYHSYPREVTDEWLMTRL